MAAATPDVWAELRAWLPTMALLASGVLAVLVMRMRAEITTSVTPLTSAHQAMDVRVSLLESQVASMPSAAQFATLTTEIKHLSAQMDSVTRKMDTLQQLLLEARSG